MCYWKEARVGSVMFGMEFGCILVFLYSCKPMLNPYELWGLLNYKCHFVEWNSCKGNTYPSEFTSHNSGMVLWWYINEKNGPQLCGTWLNCSQLPILTTIYIGFWCFVYLMQFYKLCSCEWNANLYSMECYIN